MPRSGGPGVLALDPRGSRDADRARNWPPPVLPIDNQQLFAELALYAAAPAQARHRAPEVRRWLEHDYPTIAKRAGAEGAEIHWGDETGLSNQANDGRSFAPRGNTPVIARPATRFTCSMISTLTNLGTLRFMIFDGALHAAIFLTFLQRLIKGAPRKVFLIVDNLRVHQAKLVTDWVRANSDRIALFYLPPYAPEHNPEEFMHNDVKPALARRRIPRDKASMTSGRRSYRRSLQQRPAKIRAVFQAPSVRYAA